MSVSRRSILVRVTNEQGQSTVEVAIIMAGFLAMVLALGGLRGIIAEGRFVNQAVYAASHHIQATAPGTIADIFLY